MSRKLEIGALLALCFFLPLYEAPKSIFWALYVVIWVVNRVRARDFGGRWDAWDSMIVAWIASGFVVAAFAGLRSGEEWRGAVDLLRYGSVLWLVRRARLERREINLVAGALIVSAVVGLAMGYAALWGGKGGGLQLNSVGHVNHTAIYLGIMLGVSASWAFAAWGRWGRSRRILGVVVSVSLLAGLVTTASRGAIGVGVLAVLFLAAVWWPRSRAPLAATVALVAAATVAVFVAGADVLRKHERNLQDDNVLAYRGAIWSVAVATWRAHPWFGVGMGNFGPAAREQRPPSASERDYQQVKELNFPHGHSLLFNTLAERGLVGTAALAALLLAWAGSLVRRRPAPGADDTEWLSWGSAIAAWIVTVGVGAVNTTLHNEHGILAALLAGLWLSRRPGR